MEGIQFVTNKKGQKVAVQINLKKFVELWRAKEPRKSLASVKERLRKQGKLHA